MISRCRKSSINITREFSEQISWKGSVGKWLISWAGSHFASSISKLSWVIRRARELAYPQRTISPISVRWNGQASRVNRKRSIKFTTTSINRTVLTPHPSTNEHKTPSSHPAHSPFHERKATPFFTARRQNEGKKKRRKLCNLPKAQTSPGFPRNRPVISESLMRQFHRRPINQLESEIEGGPCEAQGGREGAELVPVADVFDGRRERGEAPRPAPPRSILEEHRVRHVPRSPLDSKNSTDYERVRPGRRRRKLRRRKRRRGSGRIRRKRRWNQRGGRAESALSNVRGIWGRHRPARRASEVAPVRRTDGFL